MKETGTARYLSMLVSPPPVPPIMSAMSEERKRAAPETLATPAKQLVTPVCNAWGWEHNTPPPKKNNKT